jgi:hypothetical protein
MKLPRTNIKKTVFIFQFQDMSSSESNGHEPFELDPTEPSPRKTEPSPIELSPAPKVPFAPKKSPEDSPHRHFAGDTPFEETRKAAMKMFPVVSPPKIRQNVAQLNSHNLETQKQKIAEMNKPATWCRFYKTFFVLAIEDPAKIS